MSKKRNTNKVVLLQDDYEILTAYFKNYEISQAGDKNNFENLSGEIKRATVLKKEDFPNDVVRLNSRVTIKDKYTERIMEFTVVLPDKADIRQRKVSVLAPIGTALLGFREGQNVLWEVPAGKKNLTILRVWNVL